MKLWSSSFKHGSAIPARFAFCEPDLATHVHLAPNYNPHLAWSDIPAQAKSLALICVDPDAPASKERANQEDLSIPVSSPRADFYHWIIVNLPARDGALEAGAYSSGITVKGKKPHTSILKNGREGINDYSNWFAEESSMQGQYGGYDGPCPPWNDERLHRYFFHLYALKTASLTLPAFFDGRAAMKAIEPFVVETATLEGTYTLNRLFLNP